MNRITSQPARRHHTGRLLTLLAAVILLVTAACGAGGSEQAGADRPAVASTSTTTSSTTTTVAPEEPVGHESLVARAEQPLEVFAAPGDAVASMTLPATTGFGSRRALLVVTEQAEWLEVMLPVRPNGSTGWIRRADVELRTIDTEVLVDLTARTLTVRAAGEVVLETPVAIGSADSPTPRGHFFVTDKIDTTAPDGPYGPFAFGLSGYSDVLTEFAGGEGQIGIHGTNDPSSIGNDVSHGCIRVPNEVAVSLEALLPLGTPVTIV
jgi:lipoprotein-anchoring transpeptidase ErfK/SrfK